jgi:hypothetical protein
LRFFGGSSLGKKGNYEKEKIHVSPAEVVAARANFFSNLHTIQNYARAQANHLAASGVKLGVGSKPKPAA